MKNETPIYGIHHITAISSAAAENLAFYTQVLGLRLVKQTVNFDDPYTYHLYYGDAQGSPGTILTFFPWENLPAGRPGAGMITAVAFAVPRTAMDFWEARLNTAGCHVRAGQRFGEPLLQTSDRHGLPIELIGTVARPTTRFWNAGPIDHQNAIFGFHSATATLHSLSDERTLLTQLGMHPLDREEERYRFEMGDDDTAGRLFDVLIDPQAPMGRSGVGTVHHIAFRTADDGSQLAWQSALRKSGMAVTDVRDRNYFHSIYFHTPNGILFEIATDPPGFGIDEPLEKLGSALKLPRRYEPGRAEIARRLPPLRSTPFKHLYAAGPTAQGDSGIIVALHGSGGDERDLIGLARKLFGPAPVLSPRGQVEENGMPRFFRRLAANHLDEADVRRRAVELADFLVEAADKYKGDTRHLNALGYSNGANIAAAILLLRPEVFASAVLLRPMLPLGDTEIPDLRGKPILIVRGAHDTVIPAESTDRLTHFLERAGAHLTSVRTNAGHALTAEDMDAVRRWIASVRDCDQELFCDLRAEVPA